MATINNSPRAQGWALGAVRKQYPTLSNHAQVAVWKYGADVCAAVYSGKDDGSLRGMQRAAALKAGQELATPAGRAAQVLAPAHDAHRDSLHSAYRVVFDSFSADTREVAKVLGCDVATAHGILARMEGTLLCGDLISDGRGVVTEFDAKSRKANPGQPRIWQCCTTYDSIDDKEADALFDKWYDEKYGNLVGDAPIKIHQKPVAKGDIKALLDKGPRSYGPAHTAKFSRKQLDTMREIRDGALDVIKRTQGGK